MNHVDCVIVLILLVHVDDLNRADTEAERDKYVCHMKHHFGKVSNEFDSFDHVGVHHRQDLHTLSVTLDQTAYALQLRPITIDAQCCANLDEAANS